MSLVRRDERTALTATLDLLGVISLTGALYCLYLLLYFGLLYPSSDFSLYMVWFTISWLSVIVMKQGDIWGAYALGIATVIVGIYDLVQGAATIGGATLGAIIFITLALYVASTHDDSNQRAPLTN
ncbi:MAG: hypothetical protein AAFQ52_09150 [Chloroflexota bacterium]